MRLAGVKDGDIVEIDRAGRVFFARVVGRRMDDKELVVDPLTPGVTWLTATAHQVVGHYRRAKGSK